MFNTVFLNLGSAQSILKERPNVLFFITDDQSWIHTSFAGEVAISTPGFDKVAGEGIYFENAIFSIIMGWNKISFCFNRSS